MAKLHELLAAESTAKSQADKCRSDLLNTFDKKRHLFGEKIVTFFSNEEGKPPVTEEQSDLQSTVKSELKWIADIWTKALDIAFQISESNTQARSDVVLDNGTVILKNIPATSLLELEKRAGEIHTLVSNIPTLDPAKGFRIDTDKGENVYKAREDNRTRTKKTARPIVLYEATKEHPAQVQLIQEDIPVGTIKSQEWSGLITPAEKADMLSRAEELKRAFKTARSRANDQIASTGGVGRVIFDFVFGK